MDKKEASALIVGIILLTSAGVYMIDPLADTQAVVKDKKIIISSNDSEHLYFLYEVHITDKGLKDKNYKFSWNLGDEQIHQIKYKQHNKKAIIPDFSVEKGVLSCTVQVSPSQDSNVFYITTFSDNTLSYSDKGNVTIYLSITDFFKRENVSISSSTFNVTGVGIE